jgi:hypothetical protein
VNSALKKKTGIVAGILVVFAVLYSCQRELHFDEATAEGQLRKDANGKCAPVVTSGTFNIDTAISASNFIEVEVEVTTKGKYSLSPDTVNGY